MTLRSKFIPTLSILPDSRVVAESPDLSRYVRFGLYLRQEHGENGPHDREVPLRGRRGGRLQRVHLRQRLRQPLQLYPRPLPLRCGIQLCCS